VRRAGDAAMTAPVVEQPGWTTAEPMTMELACVVNGHPVELTIEPREALLDVLRERLGLRGAKRSCDAQVCGTCTVLVDGEPVSACTYLAYEVRDREVLTIEGLADGQDLHPIQRAFVVHGALQCGYCTPGMILTVSALLADNPNPTEAEVRAGLAGNLCRCTGYTKIIEAVLDVAHGSSQV
jgi:aerobic carbon-monoxide dehydrogenase small subunit